MYTNAFVETVDIVAKRDSRPTQTYALQILTNESQIRRGAAIISLRYRRMVALRVI